MISLPVKTNKATGIIPTSRPTPNLPIQPHLFNSKSSHCFLSAQIWLPAPRYGQTTKRKVWQAGIAHSSSWSPFPELLSSRQFFHRQSGPTGALRPPCHTCSGSHNYRGNYLPRNKARFIRSPNMFATLNQRLPAALLERLLRQERDRSV